MKKFEKLMEEYFKIKDDLLEWTECHHDSMLFDIEGYDEAMDEAVGDGDEEYIEKITDQLKAQVKAFRIILKGLSMVNYYYA